jgi:crossover junction endodeoxyribonuclease RusA
VTTVTETRTFTLTIPAPAIWLNANQRTDLRRQTPDRRAWRDAGRVYAMQAKLPKLQRAHLLAELRFSDERRRDVHNLYPSIKALVDGLIDYGLLPDDSHHYLVGPDLRYGPRVPKRVGGVSGEVFLTITDLSEVAS